MTTFLHRLSKAAKFLNPVTTVRHLERVDTLVDATRELTRSVDALRVRTEQLLAIEQLDWEQREDVRALGEQLNAGRIAAHVHRAVGDARMFGDPFPHVVVQDWLPRDVYDTVIRALPPAVFFADRDPSRQRLIVPFSLAPEFSRGVWSFLAHEVVTGMVAPAITEKFLPLIRDYVGSFCPGSVDTLDFSLHASNGRIMLRRPGYVITPHRDPKWGFVTGLVYLARPGDRDTYGTQLYRVKNDDEAPSGKPFYVDQSRCELVKSVPFARNTMLVFLNSTGAHGASIPADASPPDLERYLYQFRLGPTNQAIADMLARMPDDRRRLWVGSKSDRADNAYD